MRGFVSGTLESVRRHPTAADAVLAVVLFGAMLLSVEALYRQMRMMDPVAAQPVSFAVVLSLLSISLPLAWRRTFPCTVALVIVGSFLVCRTVVGVPEANITSLSGLLAMYSVAVHGRRPWRTPVLCLCYVTILTEVTREVFFTGPNMHPLSQGVDLAYNAVILSLPWILGSAIRSLRGRERELADQAVELRAERGENARQAVFAERVRIARELHDVVAHHVSVMGVQAGAARSVIAREPGKAIGALNSIETSSRQAVSELHRLLGFLRSVDEVDDRAPQPGLAQLTDLVRDAELAGLAVDLSVEGQRRDVSPTLDVSAYRIIQEALTNVRKHSGASLATVRVTYCATTLDVEVFDDGRGDGSRLGEGTGHGLVGMRERATLHGGIFHAGIGAEGGYAVRVSFPSNGTGA